MNQSIRLLKTTKERNGYGNDRREADRVSRNRQRRICRAKKYLERVEIKLINPPQTLEEFDALYRARKEPSARGVNSFLRHEMTNYDEIAKAVFHRFCVSMTEEMKNIIHGRIKLVTGRYLQSIGYFERERVRKDGLEDIS